MRVAFHLRRVVYPVIVAVMVGGAALTYQTKHEAIGAAEQVAELRRQIELQRNALSLLTAEWSVLTQPSRLQDLIERHPEDFPLAAYGIDQVVRIGDLPMPPEPEPPQPELPEPESPEATTVATIAGGTR